jgi:hypothetical protein
LVHRVLLHCVLLHCVLLHCVLLHCVLLHRVLLHRVLLHWHEDVGESPAHRPRLRRERDEITVGLGLGDRGRRQRGIGVDPRGEQASTVERAFNRGRRIVAEIAGEGHELPQGRTRASGPVRGPQVRRRRGIVPLRRDRFPLAGPLRLLLG